MTVAVEPITRALCDHVEVRAIDSDARTATFVAATENGVETLYGREYLRMSGIDLARYRRNPVILDAHNRSETSAVVGKAKVSVKSRELITAATFAKTTRADDIWQLVEGEFVRAMSIAFRALPGAVQVIDEGETTKVGGQTIEGPARIVKEWELYEISILPVGADVDALRRSLFRDMADLAHELRRAVPSEVNQPSIGELAMPEKKTKDAAPAEAREETVLPVATTLHAEESEAEREARDLQARRLAIEAITPRGLEDVAAKCLLDNLTVEKTREQLLKVHAERCAPVGTPEPAKSTKQATDGEGETKLAGVADDVLLRSLCG